MPLVAVVAMAQRTITGTVVEDETGDAIPQTTVKLMRKDSTLVKGVLTGLDGKFSVAAPAAGKYIVQVTCVGFKPYTKDVAVSGEQNVALGTVSMKADAIMLKGATVTGQAAKVTLKADTFRIEDVKQVRWGNERVEVLLTDGRTVETADRWEFNVVAQLFGGNIGSYTYTRLNKNEKE